MFEYSSVSASMRRSSTNSPRPATSAGMQRRRARHMVDLPAPTAAPRQVDDESGHHAQGGAQAGTRGEVVDGLGVGGMHAEQRGRRQRRPAIAGRNADLVDQQLEEREEQGPQGQQQNELRAMELPWIQPAAETVVDRVAQRQERPVSRVLRP